MSGLVCIATWNIFWKPYTESLGTCHLAGFTPKKISVQGSERRFAFQAIKQYFVSKTTVRNSMAMPPHTCVFFMGGQTLDYRNFKEKMVFTIQITAFVWTILRLITAN